MSVRLGTASAERRAGAPCVAYGVLRMPRGRPFPHVVADTCATRQREAHLDRAVFIGNVLCSTCVEWIQHTPITRILPRRGSGSENSTAVCGSVTLIQARPQMALFFGRPILVRKWFRETHPGSEMASPNDQNGMFAKNDQK